MVQREREQTCPVGQAVPQAPQLAESVSRFTQAPRHSRWPAAQLQAPPWQVRPAGQVRPQAPQFASSSARFTQMAAALVSSVPHTDSVAGQTGGSTGVSAAGASAPV